jgi:hypothetical protein
MIPAQQGQRDDPRRGGDATRCAPLFQRGGGAVLRAKGSFET